MNTTLSKRALLLFAFLTTLILLGPYGDSRVSAIDRNTYKNLKTFSEVLDMVEKNYVEPVDNDKLIQGNADFNFYKHMLAVTKAIFYSIFNNGLNN